MILMNWITAGYFADGGRARALNVISGNLAKLFK